MKTSDDVLELGLYASECCSVEIVFESGATFCRCPRCQRLCKWELVEPVVSSLQFQGPTEKVA